jgi:hypothetical protein
MRLPVSLLGNRRPLTIFPSAVAVAALWLAAGCSSGGPPAVNPHPIGDGGIAERTLLEAGSDALAIDGSDSGMGTGGSMTGGMGGGAGHGGSGPDAGDDGAASDAADALPSASVAVTVVAPAPDGAVVKAKDRFVPTAQATITLPTGAPPDDLAKAVAEIWTTEATPSKVLSTSLTTSGRVGAEAAGVTTYVFNDAAVDLSTLSSALYELRIVVTTTGQITGQASRTLKIDAGPAITVQSPVANKAYRGSVGIQVRIQDALFGPVRNVVMSLGGYVIPNVAVSTPPLDYQVTVTTTDTIPPLDGAQLLKISAENANGTNSTVSVPFVFDSTGPTITDTAPSTGQLVGGVITIKATVTDASGVDPTSVLAVVAHGTTQFTVKLGADPTTPNVFSAQFDTRLFDIHAVYPTISFRAADAPGNQSSVGYQVALDNTPPLADLDPPAVRAAKKANGQWQCSWAFDPLGSDAVNDRQMVTQLFDIRALVEDQGNQPVAGGQDIIPISLVDPNRVELLVLDDTSQPLVVDSDGDGICDKINPTLVPTSLPMSSRDALLVNLAPVPPSGSANFTADPSLQGAGCDAGNDGMPPEPLCLSTDLTMAISYAESNEPAVWTIPPVVSASLKCVGLQFDAFANHVSDGLACLAVRATDKLGNSQVSRVLRVCIDHDLSRDDCPGFHPFDLVTRGSPVQITTRTPHGLSTGAVVIVSGATNVPEINGPFTITVNGPSTFTLNGLSLTGGDTAVQAMYTTPGEVPDCTGTQTAIQPPAVSSTPRCVPWRAYVNGDVIRQY